jgi:hypothetical protein
MDNDGIEKALHELARAIDRWSLTYYTCTLAQLKTMYPDDLGFEDEEYELDEDS